MSCASNPQFQAATDPAVLAASWFAQVSQTSNLSAEVATPAQPAETLAAFTTIVLNLGKTLLILVPDDEPLPSISSTLDLALRPLCLVLPSADFAARIALRATLSLLKSRLARDSDDEQGLAWQDQRTRIKASSVLWQQAQIWTASNDRNPWPQEVAKLFPARVLPIAAFRALPAQAADFTVLVNSSALPEAMLLGGQHLLVGKAQNTPHFNALALADEATRLRIELAQLTLDVGELELELATAQAEMAEFTRRYYELVGRRMTELDVILATVAHQLAVTEPEDINRQGESERLKKQAEESSRENQRFSQFNLDREPAPTFRPDQNIKRLFRQLAQKIHPDRAQDETDRAWRTQLMSEANRAYRAGDTAALQQVYQLWNESLGLNRGNKTILPADSNHALVQQLARMRSRFEAIETELHRVFGSRLYELFLAARQANRSGRDLLQEMADKLDERITEARAQLASFS